MNCPHCHKRINVGKLLRSKKPTAAQRAAAKLNGAKGGRPKKPVARMPNAGTQRPGTPDGPLATETRKPGSLK